MMMYRFAELEERKEIKMNRSSQYLPNIEAPIHRCSDSSASSKRSCSSDDEKKGKAKSPEKKKVSIVRPNDILSYDILCGRDKATFNNIGNRRFRVSISINIPRYEAAKSKAQKAEVIKFVCNVLRKEVGVRFLKRQNGSASKRAGEDEDYYYVELQETDARKKVGHALRDMSVARQQLNQKRTDAKRQRANEISAKNSNKKLKSIVDNNNDNDNDDSEGNDDDDLMNTLLEPLPIDDVHPPQPQPRRQSHTTEMIEETRRLSLQIPQQVSSIQTTDALSQIEQQHIQFQHRQQQFRELQNQQIQQHQQQQRRQQQQQQHQQLDRQYHQLDQQQHQMLRLLQQPQTQPQQQRQRQQYDEHNVFYHHHMFHPHQQQREQQRQEQQQRKQQ